MFIPRAELYTIKQILPTHHTLLVEWQRSVRSKEWVIRTSVYEVNTSLVVDAVLDNAW